MSFRRSVTVPFTSSVATMLRPLTSASRRMTLCTSASLRSSEIGWPKYSFLATAPAAGASAVMTGDGLPGAGTLAVCTGGAAAGGTATGDGTGGCAGDGALGEDDRFAHRRGAAARLAEEGHDGVVEVVDRIGRGRIALEQQRQADLAGIAADLHLLDQRILDRIPLGDDVLP